MDCRHLPDKEFLPQCVQQHVLYTVHKVYASACQTRACTAQVILAFSRPFWPEQFFDVICTDCFIPEFWVTSYPATAQDSSTLHSMVGFIAGKKAEVLSSMPHSDIILNALKQLDQIYGKSCQEHRCAFCFFIAAPSFS